MLSLYILLSIARLCLSLNGGTETPPNTIPYIVALISSTGDFHRCAGILISPQTILTAASCIQNQTPETLTVRIGQNRTAGTQRTLSTITTHPDYDIDTRFFDLAALTLDNPVEDTPAVLGDSILGNVTLYGWGLTHYAVGIFPDNLHQLPAVGITRDECREQWKGIHSITEGMVCDQPPTEMAAWLGDKGGPVVAEDGTVAGLISFSIYDTDLRKALPDVHTNLEYFRDWIGENTV